MPGTQRAKIGSSNQRDSPTHSPSYRAETAYFGKVHRLGLAGRPRISRPPTTSRRSSPRPRAALSIHSRPPLSSIKVLPVLPELDPAPQIPVTIATLTGDTCHWPEGDPKAPGFHFCGRRTSSSGPYCEVHATIARARQVVRLRASIHFLTESPDSAEPNYSRRRYDARGKRLLSLR
jgi:GcrA cell cycle regulator